MEKRLYPLSGVSMGGGDAPCLDEWFPLEGVQPQMLEQICWASLSPNLSLGEIISCPDLGTALAMPASAPAETAWLGKVGSGIWRGNWFALGCCWGGALLQWQQLTTPLPWFLGSRTAWMTWLSCSIKFPWLSRWRHHCKVFWGQHLQESKNWVSGCFPKCSHPCGPWPHHPFSAVQAELQEKQLFVFFPTLPVALSPMPVAAWQCLPWWRGGRVPREGGKMAHHFLCAKIPSSVFSTFPDTSILLSAALSQLYSLQWFSSPNKCRLFREHFF